MSIEAMKQALEALERLVVGSTYEDAIAAEKAITALRTAIEAAEKQEPVAWNSGVPPLYPEINDGETISVEYVEATPPAAYPEFECPRCGHCCAQRQPLTDEKIWLEYQRFWPFHPAEEPRLAKDIAKFARAIEAAHGITGEKT